MGTHDNLGYGRLPQATIDNHMETVMLLITDANSDAEQFTLVNQPTVAAEYWTEPWRWDQQIVAIVLRYGADGGCCSANVDTPRIEVETETALGARKH